jgi:hypothetical protein
LFVLRLTRSEFLDEYWDYRPGEHVSFIAPTGAGKTHLAYSLLDAAMKQNPALNVACLMPKPQDSATTQFAKSLQLKEVPDWPPRKRWWEDKPRGYVCWPHHDMSLDAAANREQIANILRKCLHQQYWRGNSITFADDVHNLAVLMGLNAELETFWTAGRSSGSAVWSANQKPSGTLNSGSVSSFSYHAPSHLFLGHDSDERNIRRFGEIGAVDPREIEGVVRNLKLYQINGNTVSEVLYIDRRGPYVVSLLPW